MRGAAILTAGLFLVLQSVVPGRAGNDYPTSVVVEYVLGCMRVNGRSREALDRCSCSFDAMASLLTYDEYVRAETAARMELVPGARGNLFRSNPATDAMIQAMKRAQAEAELQCF